MNIKSLGFFIKNLFDSRIKPICLTPKPLLIKLIKDFYKLVRFWSQTSLGVKQIN